jgi:hypothetical protein
MLVHPDFKAEDSGLFYPILGATDTIPSAARPSAAAHLKLPYSYERQFFVNPQHVVAFIRLTHNPFLSYTHAGSSGASP